MKYPNIITVDTVIKNSKECTTLSVVSNSWVPARPLGYPSIGFRLRATWLVFTGKADALLWDGQ